MLNLRIQLYIYNILCILHIYTYKYVQYAHLSPGISDPLWSYKMSITIFIYLGVQPLAAKSAIDDVVCVHDVYTYTYIYYII